MGDPMLTYTLLGAPRTKKNSQRIFKGRGGQPFLVPSAAYAQYEKDCLRQIHSPRQPVAAVNLKCVYYMPNRRRVDLVNLMEATCDILVKAGVLDDDCAAVVAGHDGSRVKYSKECPRTEIEITEVNDNDNE